MKLLDAVHKKFKLASVTKARKLIKSGFVLVNQAPQTRPDTEIGPGDTIALLEHTARRATKTPFEILFEDPSILVTVKPAGILVEDFHKQICEYTLVILTHRLDRKVSGVMIFAKTPEIEHILEANWAQNDKIYVALVENKPPKPEGRIESYLAENKKSLKVYSTEKGPDSKLAITHYRSISPLRLEISLETGRKNQIRVHLSDLGCPIVGDTKYGAQTFMRGRIALHAYRLSFYHPISHERMTFAKDPPF